MNYYNLYLEALQTIEKLEEEKIVAEENIKSLELMNDILRMAGEEILKQRDDAYRVLQDAGHMGGFTKDNSH